MEECFSAFSFVFYNVVKLGSSLLTYPKATGQTVWQGNIICHHCAYGHSLRSLLKGALRSFTAVARLVWAPASAGPCVMTPGGRNTPCRPSMSTPNVQMQAMNNTHIAREIHLLWSPFVFSCCSWSPAALAVIVASGKSSVPVMMNKLGAESSHILVKLPQNKGEGQNRHLHYKMYRAGLKK